MCVHVFNRVSKYVHSNVWSSGVNFQEAVLLPWVSENGSQLLFHPLSQLFGPNDLIFRGSLTTWVFSIFGVIQRKTRS